MGTVTLTPGLEGTKPEALGWAALGWAALGWAALGWAALDWAALDSAALDWTALDWTALDWTALDWTALDWTGLETGMTGRVLLEMTGTVVLRPGTPVTMGRTPVVIAV
jgi:hypothetical protein